MSNEYFNFQLLLYYYLSWPYPADVQRANLSAILPECSDRGRSWVLSPFSIDIKIPWRAGQYTQQCKGRSYENSMYMPCNRSRAYSMVIFRSQIGFFQDQILRSFCFEYKRLHKCISWCLVSKSIWVWIFQYPTQTYCQKHLGKRYKCGIRTLFHAHLTVKLESSGTEWFWAVP